MKNVQVVDLSPKDEIKLLELLGKEEVTTKKAIQTHILLLVNDGYTNKQIAKALLTSQDTGEWMCKQYIESGLEHSLDESLSGGKRKLLA